MCSCFLLNNKTQTILNRPSHGILNAHEKKKDITQNMHDININKHNYTRMQNNRWDFVKHKDYTEIKHMHVL